MKMSIIIHFPGSELDVLYKYPLMHYLKNLRNVRGLVEAVNLNSFSDEIHGLPPTERHINNIYKQ